MQLAALKQNELIAGFWQVASDFYAKEPVKEILLFLQDEHSLSINRLLFALWFSQKFQQIIESAPLQKSILDAENSVTELRSVRREFEDRYNKPYLGNINMTRYHMLEAELSLEKEIQTALVIGFCSGLVVSELSISDESLDFLISENIARLCPSPSHTADSFIQKLSMLWIQQQG